MGCGWQEPARSQDAAAELGRAIELYTSPIAGSITRALALDCPSMLPRRRQLCVKDDTARFGLVLDNLNIHTPRALYETFPAAEARALATRIEWHFTPKHGRWLNIQEIEWAILKRQVFRHQRLATQAAVEQAVTVWAAGRTQRRIRVNWRFTLADARLTMHHCYPIPNPRTDTA